MVSVQSSVRLRVGIGIRQGQVFRLRKGPIHQARVELIHFSRWGRLIHIKGALGIPRKITEGPILRNFTGINFVGKIPINQVFGPCRGTDRGIFRVEACNTGNHPITLG